MNWTLKAPLLGCIMAAISCTTTTASEDAGARSTTLPTTSIPIEATKEDILAALRLKLSDVVQCYEKQLETDPKLSGRLEIELEIGIDGNVSRGQLLVNEVGSPLLEVCIVRTLTAWTFPPPPNQEPLMLQIPFDFTPRLPTN